MGTIELTKAGFNEIAAVIEELITKVGELDMDQVRATARPRR